MGCIFTKVCDEEDLNEVGDGGDKAQQMKQEAARRLSRAKSTLLIVEPREAAIANSSNPNNNRTPLKQNAQKSDDPFLETTYYGGGIPGVALDAERVELSEFTGAREGGYKSVNGRLRWGTRSRSGNDPLRRRKENQDSFCVCDTLAEEKNLTFFSVFDGHGPEGAYVSHFVRELYHENLADSYAANVRRTSSSSHRASVSCDLITETFQQAARAVSEKLTDSTIDISVSGTTAVAMLVSDGDIFIANLGDSRGVVAQFSEPDDVYVLHCETRDHKPDVPEERQRIEANNGRVFEWGTFRVWLQDVDMPGLAMSRSFGDAVAKTVGVTCDPEVTIVEKVAFGRKERPSFAVLASDGVWEFMTSDECIDFVAQCILKSNMTPQEACDALVEEACERWNAEDDVVDDITAAIVYF
uniref:PPM-type phosphatase domain-containing protein n=1 Tax=Globisporangium ultimum (strain ATCC 200006 / CBS 805.95 / DAOM BR144) TaxID=431595 RepID=K3WDY4_GLOUD